MELMKKSSSVNGGLVTAGVQPMESKHSLCESPKKPLQKQLTSMLGSM